MESLKRRSGIPIPKSKSPLKKHMSKSSDDLLGDSYADHNTSGDLDLFTLLEENIALKEKTENLLSQKNSLIQKNVHLERENSRLSNQLKELTGQQAQLKGQLQTITSKFQKDKDDQRTKENIQMQQNKTINDLMQKIRQQEEKHIELLNAAKKAKNKLDEFAPDITSIENDHSTHCDIVTADIVEQLIAEIGKIKTQLSNTELQLYEANEKMADIIENHGHLKDENESLRIENSNLTKVAKLMTTSMKESVDTSKRMEEALLDMKKKYNELLRENMDAADGPTTVKIASANDEVSQLKDELKKREVVHSERIVEMSKLMENTIKINTNDELNVLRIKLEMIEKDLHLAIDRAERAEAELEQLKYSRKNCQNSRESNQNQNTVCCVCNGSAAPNPARTEAVREPTTLPPPPPPPLPPPPPVQKFNLPPTNSVKNGVSLSDGIAAFARNNARQGAGSSINVKNQQVQKATGMDALIAQLRDGTVTLRRNRRETTSTAALKEMFETLELSRQQNRSSRIVVESHRKC